MTERLAGEFMVVCPDLRGYGESPKSGSDFSKRAMAADVLALMHQLGYERFAVAGHDRGALVGQRLALEHPEAVSHLAVLDNVPVLDLSGGHPRGVRGLPGRGDRHFLPEERPDEVAAALRELLARPAADA